MPGLGTVTNVAAIVAGGLLGLVAGKAVGERLQDGLGKACGVCVLFIGIAGAMQGMLALDGGRLASGKSLFVAASVVVGAVQDGAFGDWSVLATKAVLDFVIILVMTCSMGKGCVFSALPVGVNLVWGPKLRVANMLPAIVVAPLLMMLPVAW